LFELDCRACLVRNSRGGTAKKTCDFRLSETVAKKSPSRGKTETVGVPFKGRKKRGESKINLLTRIE